MEFVPREKAQAIREPSTANLLIDSIDRTGVSGAGGGASSANFTITKKNSLMNGFFTRMAVSEVVLDWSVPNIALEYGNNTFSVEIEEGAVQYTVTLINGNYTIAQILAQIVSGLNALAGSSFFSITGSVTTTGYASLTGTGNFEILASTLASQLGMITGAFAVGHPIQTPAVLPVSYLDFCCDQLTYNQSLKDETTNEVAHNVLYRWVMAWDGPSPVDTLGYPIYQGYQPFRARRILPFPKQVRWESNMPLGQMSFQVYDSTGEIVFIDFPQSQMEWNMCLLVSEV